MEDDHKAKPWGAPSSRRQRGTLVAAAGLHLALLLALLHWQGRFELPRAVAVVETTIWTPAPPRVTRAPAPREPVVAASVAAPSARQARRREPVPLTPPAAPSPTITLPPMAVASAPPASAASAPLRLTLSPADLKALEAATGRTLGQLTASGPKPSTLSQIGGGDDGLTEKQLPGGITEVHLHGACYRLVPTTQSQLDPFNPSPRLTGPCLPNF